MSPKPQTLRHQHADADPSAWGCCFSIGASRKCLSTSSPPRRNSSKWLGADLTIVSCQADARPDRIAPADPIPEAEDAVGPDAELACTRSSLVDTAAKWCADGGPRRVRPMSPGPRRAGIGHRLLRRERLGGDDEQRRRGIELDAGCRRGRRHRRSRRNAWPIARVDVGCSALARPSPARGPSRRCRC